MTGFAGDEWRGLQGTHAAGWTGGSAVPDPHWPWPPFPITVPCERARLSLRTLCHSGGPCPVWACAGDTSTCSAHGPGPPVLLTSPPSPMGFYGFPSSSFWGAFVSGKLSVEAAPSPPATKAQARVAKPPLDGVPGAPGWHPAHLSSQVQQIERWTLSRRLNFPSPVGNGMR